METIFKLELKAFKFPNLVIYVQRGNTQIFFFRIHNARPIKDGPIFTSSGDDGAANRHQSKI